MNATIDELMSTILAASPGTPTLTARKIAKALLAEHPATPAEEPAEVAVEEREALAARIARIPLRQLGWSANAEDIADGILASDWLRNHDAALTAKAKAEALREAADEADSIGHHWSGAPALAFFALAGDLRERANRERA